MQGKTKEEVEAEMGTSLNENLVPFKIFEGNRPTTTILANAPDPRTIGKLVACYEHKIFVQGLVWNIFSYDQWGVELGKQLAAKILPALDSTSKEKPLFDSSTAGLISKFHKDREKK